MSRQKSSSLNIPNSISNARPSRRDFSLSLDQAEAFFSVLQARSSRPYQTTHITDVCQGNRLALQDQVVPYQCQLLTLVPSGRASTIHLGSPSPHFAMTGANKLLATAPKKRAKLDYAHEQDSVIFFFVL